MFPRKFPAPTVALASKNFRLPRHPDAALQSGESSASTLLPPAPALADIRAPTHSAYPAVRPWFRDPGEPSPARRPSSSPAWHRSARAARAKTNPTLHAARAVQQLAKARPHQCRQQQIARLILACAYRRHQPHPPPHFAFAQNRKRVPHGMNLALEGEHRVHVTQQTIADGGLPLMSFSSFTTSSSGCETASSMRR